MSKSRTSDISKTVGESTKHFSKDDIYVSMEHLPDLDTYAYKVECHGCKSQCDFSFLYRSKLSFAFVAKFAGVFSSACKKLDAAAANKKPLAGLPLPGFNAVSEVK